MIYFHLNSNTFDQPMGKIDCCFCFDLVYLKKKVGLLGKNIVKICLETSPLADNVFVESNFLQLSS